MKRSLVSALASLLLAMDVRAAEPRWTVEFKEGAYTFLTATGLEVGQKTGPGAIAGYLVVKLPPDVDPATTNRGVFLGRVRVPERRVTWLKGDEFAAGELLPAHHLIAITPNAGFEPGLWAVKVRDTVKDRSGRPVNPTNATWTVEIGEPRARPDDPGPARNTLKLKFTTEVDPATYADGIVVEKQVAGNWQEEQRGSATIAPSAHGGSVNEIGLRPLGGWERGATYRVRVTDAIRDVRGQPLTNAEDFSFTVPKSGPFETRHEPRRPVAQANVQAASAGPAFPGGQALGWHGHWTDPVTGLIYMRNRWYDPRTGTFLSPDPLEDIDSPNQYLFGAGRPHEVVDPLGLAVSTSKRGIVISDERNNGYWYLIPWALAYANPASTVELLRRGGLAGSALDEFMESNGINLGTDASRAQALGLMTSQELARAQRFTIHAETEIATAYGAGKVLGLVGRGIASTVLKRAAQEGSESGYRLLARELWPSYPETAVMFPEGVGPAQASGRAGSATGSVSFPSSVRFTPSTGRTYTVYQRADIDWSQVRTAGPRDFIGKTNAEAAKAGFRPQLPDGEFATLHHAEQSATGPWFEASTRYHNIRTAQQPPLHPYEGGQNPYAPLGRGPGSPRDAFQTIESPEYWQWREAHR